MSTSAIVEQKSGNESQAFIPSCIILDRPVKTNLQRLAKSKHTSISHLLNVAAEEYLRKYVESQKEPVIII